MDADESEELDALAQAAADAKRVDQLLRDARSVQRRLDVLAATAAAAEDESLETVAEARAAVDRLVRELMRRQQAASRPSRRAGGWRR